jgi:hypothetical protein
MLAERRIGQTASVWLSSSPDLVLSWVGFIGVLLSLVTDSDRRKSAVR